MNNILSMVSSIIGNKGVAKAPARQGYFTSMVIESGDAPYDTAAELIALIPAVGVKARIWEYTVPAQMAVSWGFGTPLTPANQGYIWFALLDAGTGFAVGTVLLSHENHARHVTIPVAEFNDSGTHEHDNTSLATARTNNKEHLFPLPEGGNKGGQTPLVGQDSRLVIDYTPISLPAAVDVAGFDIPATIYD